MRVPRRRFEAITKTVNGFGEAAQDYDRNRALNRWFVTGADSTEHVTENIRVIEQANSLNSTTPRKLEESYLGMTLTA